MEQNKMADSLTWAELYTFLDSMSDDASPEEWNSKVVIHNMETDEEYASEILYIHAGNRPDEERLVLGVNFENLDN